MCSRTTGFVLPMTLVLLTLAAAVMVNFCTRSVLLTAQASHATDDLQQRWAIASIRRAVLPQAETLLAEKEQSTNGAVPLRAASVVLGGRRFDLTITDEQAKANVNLMLARLGQSATEQTMHEMLARRRSDIQIDLRPLAPSDRSHPSPFPGAARVGSFAQMFKSPSPTSLLQGDSVISQLTCFGDGRINLRRTSHAALLGLTRQLLTQKQVESLLVAQHDPDATIDQLLAPLTLTKDAAAQVQSMVTFKSGCHGLWITAQASGMTPAAASFSAIDDAGGASEQVLTW